MLYLPFWLVALYGLVLWCLCFDDEPVSPYYWTFQVYRDGAYVLTRENLTSAAAWALQLKEDVDDDVAIYRVCHEGIAPITDDLMMEVLS